VPTYCRWPGTFFGVELQLSEDAAAALLASRLAWQCAGTRNSMERAKLMARDGIVSAADLKLPAAGESRRGGWRCFPERFRDGRQPRTHPSRAARSRRQCQSSRESWTVPSGAVPPHGAFQHASAQHCVTSRRRGAGGGSLKVRLGLGVPKRGGSARRLGVWLGGGSPRLLELLLISALP